eukprot:scaffold136804_cov148-Phaeocystis_antarctica.AAC.1
MRAHLAGARQWSVKRRNNHRSTQRRRGPFGRTRRGTPGLAPSAALREARSSHGPWPPVRAQPQRGIASGCRRG